MRSHHQHKPQVNPSPCNAGETVEICGVPLKVISCHQQDDGDWLLAVSGPGNVQGQVYACDVDLIRGE